ncbi:FecCD family ABC transporter permease [Pseudonocardia abyssalis]|uniref:Iron ABC transporter permease n=3 Tax=Pseudonocardia abyssalis TaxID=2792008 RepID=A0ABS6UM86_9PSEU|nr:iron ABC transporter permease [Pseudonocardia abyssalis]MBW0132914.1 iron ABC transporter permease [Pseudonocardia abyssalis]
MTTTSRLARHGGPARALPRPDPRGWGAVVLLAVAAVGALVLAVAVGPVVVSPADTVAVLLGLTPADPTAPVLIGSVRVPRALTAALAGAALGVAGLQLQTLFRNPLAEPYVLGVSAGASLGVALAVAGTAGGSAGTFTAGVVGAGRAGTVVAAAVGAGFVLGVVLLLSRWVRSGIVLLIVGVMLGSLATAGVSLLLTVIDPQRAQQFIAWGLGSFSGTTGADLAVLAPVVGVGLLVALAGTKSLNALLLGEDYARSVGVRIGRVRLVILVSSAVLAGAVTAFCGPVAFLGMAVPHLARLAAGTSDHRVLLPVALLTGALVALVCAVAAHLPWLAGPIPVNVITSVVGAPVVIAVLIRSRVVNA